MRTSSFSNAKVIDLLNGYFVPVHISNDDCREGGPAPVEERELRDRIYRAALEAGLDAGTVCAYLVTPEGKPVATAPLNRDVAADPVKLAELMERVVRDLDVTKGEPLVPPQPYKGPKAVSDDSLMVHVVTRYLERKGDELVPYDLSQSLGTKQAIGWGNLPSESWVELSRDDWLKLLPTGDVAADTAWQPDAKVAAMVLNHFYPPTENTDLAKNRLDELSLSAKVESVNDGVVRARVEGRLRMKHPFYHDDDKNFVSADTIGYLEFDADKKAIRSFELVTDGATYGGNTDFLHPFGAAVRSVAPPK